MEACQSKSNGACGKSETVLGYRAPEMLQRLQAMQSRSRLSLRLLEIFFSPNERTKTSGDEGRSTSQNLPLTLTHVYNENHLTDSPSDVPSS